ncbi:T9SS type A sorting domain-containing protein [candidate division KSB1 bacterium]|nr:T9SS type A sorting domain-containing protein [candidate division KSB1 bacterium]
MHKNTGNIISITALLILSLGTIALAADEIPQPVLMEPENRTLVHTSTPVFSWKSTDDPRVEYRIMIAEWTGKIIHDEWLGNTDQYQVTQPDMLKDLQVYLWTVSAYRNQETVQSETYSLCIDLNVSLDLEIVQVKLLTKDLNWQPNQKVDFEVQVLNCGPVPCNDAVVLLGNGNFNSNYTTNNSFRQTETIDSLKISKLNSGQSKMVRLSGYLKPGFNRFYAKVKTPEEYIDIFQNNNSRSGPVIQTNENKLQLNGLFVIYDKIYNPNDEVQQIKDDKLSEIHRSIDKVKNFYWEHTRTIQITSDTMLVRHPLQRDDLRYIDQKWGYVLKPEKIEHDLQVAGFRNDEFDFVYVFYPWANTVLSWSGFHGYSYGDENTILGDTYFSAQPVFENSIVQYEIGVHEILHLIDNFYEKQGISNFYSPEQQDQVTTFVNHLDYCEWILETWHTKDWFLLDKGTKLITADTDDSPQKLEPTDLILHQNYPNPFNSSTVISYELAHNESHVELAIYNLLGVKVRSLVNEYQKRGHYSARWDGRDDNGQDVSTGIYFYSLKAGNRMVLNKLLFIK